MLKFLLLSLYLFLPFNTFIDTKGNWFTHALNFNFQLTPSKKLSLKKYNKSKKPTAPVIQTKKSRKSPTSSIRTLSSTYIQTEIDKYRQALLLLCTQAEETNAKEQFLSFIQSVNSLRKLIKDTIQNFSDLKEEDNVILSRMENYINEEALPIQKILKEPGAFEEKASTLRHFFEIYYRNHHKIPETQTIFEAQTSAETLPKAIFEALTCISPSEPI